MVLRQLRQRASEALSETCQIVLSSVGPPAYDPPGHSHPIAL